jgi:hypothetical protein
MSQEEQLQLLVKSLTIFESHCKIFSLLHCNENPIYVFPEKDLRGLSPNFHIRVSVSYLYIPRIALIWNHYFPVLHERTLGSTAGAEGRAGNCRQPLLGGSFLPFSPLLQLSQNLYVGHICELSAQLQERRRGQGTLPPTPAWRQFPALLSAPAVEPRVFSCNTGK